MASKRRQDRRKGKISLPRAATVGIVNVEVSNDALGHPAINELRNRQILGRASSAAIDHGLQRRIVDGLETFSGLGYRIDEIRVASAQRLDAINDSHRLSLGCCGCKTFTSTFESFLAIIVLPNVPLLGRAVNQRLAAQIKRRVPPDAA